jgi:small subunit ribosomal protein S17
MSTERNSRKERQGVVVSTAGEKTCVVRVQDRKRHPLYGKMITRSAKFHAHDENNECGVGDVVRIMETRPISKMKRWRLVEIVEKAK